MRFNLSLSAADLCILLEKIITSGPGPVLHQLGKIVLEELSERLDEGTGEGIDSEYQLDLTDIALDELSHVVVQLEGLSKQIDSREIKNFVGSMITVLRAEQISRKI